jgi:hypothetical protein
MDIPLSNEEIASALGITQSYFVKYADLSNYGSLDELFGDRQCMIILIEETKASGHWVCMVRTGPSTYLYNNSYGKAPDWDLSVIGMMRNQILGNTRNSIRTLKEESNATITWNHVEMQGRTSETCGRYTIVFIHSVMTEGMTMSEYQAYMLKMKKRYKSYDAAVVALTTNQNALDA